MRITLDIPPMVQDGRHESLAQNALALRALLDCLVRVNLAYLTYCGGRVPLLSVSGVTYGRTDVWDSIPALFAPKYLEKDRIQRPNLYGRAYGDCKSLSACRIAQHLFAGVHAEPEFRFVPNTTGGYDFHILVRTYREVEDPSKECGMGRDENAYFMQSRERGGRT